MTKNLIITGASSGFGRALTELTGRRRYRGRCHATSGSDRRPGRPVSADPSAAGGVDVLVNNAGVGQIGAAEEIGDADVRDMIDQHLLGPAALTRAVLPGMRDATAGTIVQISSQGGRISFPGAGSYSAGKFALEGWSEALAGEVAPFGIRVLIVEPSRFRTAFNGADFPDVPESNRPV